MTAYAIGHLRNVAMGPEIAEYVREIDATFEPFGGRWAIHGATPDVKEGRWEGDLIAIAFPDMEAARAWYRSPAYQRLVPLRARNAEGEVLLLEGAPEGHRGADILG